MLAILKTKLEIALMILIAFQGHTLYQKTKDGFTPTAGLVDERMVMGLLKSHNASMPTGDMNPAELQHLLAMIPKDGASELGVALPADLSTFKINKQQAIALINSLPDE